MKIGDRVHVDGEGVGIVEEVDGDFLGVRWLTPNNKPSCLTTFGIRRCDARKVGDNVLPQPRSEAWKAESAAFCSAVSGIVESMLEGESNAE